MSGKEKTNKTRKKQKGLEYDSPNDSKKPQTLLPKIPVPTTTHRGHDNDKYPQRTWQWHCWQSTWQWRCWQCQVSLPLQAASAMTAINTKVPDERWQPRWPPWRQSSSALELVQCSALRAEGKSVTFYSVLTICLCEQSVGQYSFNLNSSYFLKTKIPMLPLSQIGRKDQLRLLKKAHKLWSCFVFSL